MKLRGLDQGFDAAAIKRQFPGLVDPRLHYLDNAATARMPEAVLGALRWFEIEARANVHEGVHRLARAAAEMVIGMGANVTVVARARETLRRLSQLFGERVRAIAADPETIGELCVAADVVIGAALVPGAAGPKLISIRTVKAMKPGSVIVDVSIDQGGCAGTSRPTTDSQPTFVLDGVVHYCVANMPGAVPRTSTFALGNATRPFVLALADKGFPRALLEDPHLQHGLNVHDGKITCRP